MGNTSGQAYAFMAATPILPGKELSLLDYLAALPGGEDSPLARMGSTHFARWLVMHDVIYQGPPQVRDSLKSAYLFFITNFDGELETYLDALLDEMSAEADEIWRHCVGFPGTTNRDAFKTYMKHNQMDTAFFVSAYPEATVAQVRESIQLRSDLASFAIDNQASGARTLQQQWTKRFPAQDGGSSARKKFAGVK